MMGVREEAGNSKGSGFLRCTCVGAGTEVTLGTLGLGVLRVRQREKLVTFLDSLTQDQG